MDISKIRKKIKEARDEDRRRHHTDPVRNPDPSPDKPADSDQDSSAMRTASEAESRTAYDRIDATLEDSIRAEDIQPGIAEDPASMTDPLPQAESEDVEEDADIDDYLDRDELYDRNRAGSQLKLLAFRLGDEEYAVSMLEMKEVQVFREVTRVPRTPDYLLGIMSLRGKVIPVLDLRRRLGIGGSDPEAPRILVFSMEGEPVGARVDTITGVLTTWTDEILPSLTTLSEDESRFISGVIRTDQRFVSMLNLEELLQIELQN